MLGGGVGSPAEQTWNLFHILSLVSPHPNHFIPSQTFSHHFKSILAKGHHFTTNAVGKIM